MFLKWPSLFGNFILGSIAGGDNENGQLSQEATRGWAGAEGYVTFTDQVGDEWVTRSPSSVGKGEQLVCEHDAPALLSELGELGRFYPPSSL